VLACQTILISVTCGSGVAPLEECDLLCLMGCRCGDEWSAVPDACVCVCVTVSKDVLVLHTGGQQLC